MDLCTLPILNVVKVRLQTPAARYKGTLDCVISTVRQEKVSNTASKYTNHLAQTVRRYTAYIEAW